MAEVSARPAAVAREMVGLKGLVHLGNQGLERGQARVLSPQSSLFHEEIGAVRGLTAAELRSARTFTGAILPPGLEAEPDSGQSAPDQPLI